MTDSNSKANRVVWFDIPVADLDRATTFYEQVLSIKVEKANYGNIKFCILEHNENIGGCLVVKPDEVSADKGPLMYMNVDGRIKDAIKNVEKNNGKIVDDIHSIGSYGFRAIVLDSEGNRIALHSETEA